MVLFVDERLGLVANRWNPVRAWTGRGAAAIPTLMNLGTRLFTWFRGREVGSDSAGNRYFEEKRAVAGRRARRWVRYAGSNEPTRIPPEWYGWMHYTLDAPLPETNRRPWQKPHLPNVTGTAAAYRPPGHDYAGGNRPASRADYQAWTPES